MFCFLGDVVGSEQAIKKLLEIYPKSTAVNAEIQNCKCLRDLEEKATKALEENEYRTVVFFMDSALKIAKSCYRYKLKKAECLVALGRIDVNLNKKYTIENFLKILYLFLGSK